jgi:hypothetical protein
LFRTHFVLPPFFFIFHFGLHLSFFYFDYYLWPGAPAKFYWLALCDCSAGTHKWDWHTTLQRPSLGRQLIEKKNNWDAPMAPLWSGSNGKQWNQMRIANFGKSVSPFFLYSFFKYKRNQKKGKPKLDG